MRILLLSQFFKPVIGGEERIVEDLGFELASRGHKVAVATLGVEGAAGSEVVCGVRVYRVDSLVGRAKWLFTESRRRHAPPAPDPAVVRGLREIIDAERPDVLHAHNWIVYSLLPLRRRRPVPLVLTLHDYSLVCATKRLMRGGLPCEGPGLGRCLGCAGRHYGPAKGAATVLAQRAATPSLRRSVDAYLPVSRAVANASGLTDSGLPYEVIPNFLPRRRERQPEAGDDSLLSQLPEGDFVLFAGDASVDKGVNVLLDAHAALADAPELVVLGRKLVPGTNGVPGARFLGPWPHEAVLQAMRRCAMLVVPSIWPEPFGLVALEAMSAGRPVIASRRGGLVDIVVDGKTGLLVPPGDRQALSQALRELLDDLERRSEMGRAAAARAEQFSADSIVPRIERTYESLAGSTALRGS